MDREDQIEIYTIPPNFAEEGTVFSGRINRRRRKQEMFRYLKMTGCGSALMKRRVQFRLSGEKIPRRNFATAFWDGRL